MSAKKKKAKLFYRRLYSAIAAFQGGMSKRKASQQWNVPRTTLIDSCAGTYQCIFMNKFI